MLPRCTNQFESYSVQDVDGDDVRCRWAVGNECGGVCQTFPAVLNMVKRILCHGHHA